MTDLISTEPLVIDQPGVYDLTDEAYHGDPVPGGSLSASGAKRLLDPYCPAIYRYERDHGRPPKRVFDFGHAAHTLVLGTGPEIRVIDAKDYKTKKAQEERAAAYADGAVPALTEEYAKAQAMAAVLRQHPLASALFNPEHGKAEQSLFWVDEDFGVWRRSRLDWLPDAREAGTGRMLLVDYKTTTSVAPAAISKAVHNYSYHSQAAWYLDAVEALHPNDGAVFIFVFQMKEPPYLITIAQLDEDNLRIGRGLNRQALERFRDCQQSGVWPGYSNEVELISPPRWAVRNFEESYA